MTDRPIIFSAQMIRALLDGRKTQTRRVLKSPADGSGWYRHPATGEIVNSMGGPPPKVRFAVGDRLWVRENWAHDIEIVPYAGLQVYYSADIDLRDNKTVRQRPSIHMPRWASRLTLIVESVKVERLQDISEGDAAAEGAGLYVPGHGFITEQELRCDPGYSNFLSPRLGFEMIWSEINGPESWAANPWVAAIAFRCIKANIDTIEIAMVEKEAA